MNRIFIFLISGMFFLTACHFSKQRLNNDADCAKAVLVVNNFYRMLGEKKIDSARNLFHSNLLATNDSVKFREFLMNISAQVPAIKERTLDHYASAVTFGLNAGENYALFYINKYQGGQQLKVSIQLMNDGDKIKIINYQADPNNFK